MLQVGYGGGFVQYVASALNAGLNTLTSDVAAALCVAVPDALNAAANPIFPFVGAADGTYYGATALNSYDEAGFQNGSFAPDNAVIGFLGPTSLTSVGATPEAVPPAMSNVDSSTGYHGPVESSIWSLSADEVPLVSAHWVNPADDPVQNPTVYIYEYTSAYLLISANPNLPSALQLPPGYMQQVSMTFIQTPCSHEITAVV